MWSIKTIVFNLRYFIRSITKITIPSPFLAYEGNYELDLQNKKFPDSSKSLNFMKDSKHINNSLSEKMIQDLNNFLQTNNNNLTTKSRQILTNFIEDKLQQSDILDSIFLFSYLIDGTPRKLYNYPNLHLLLQRSSSYSKIFEGISQETLDFLKKDLLKKIISLRYFSNLKISLRQLIFIIYAVEVSSKTMKIEESLDKDLLITLIKSLKYQIQNEFPLISSKAALFLLKACNEYCFSTLEAKNQKFNALMLELIEIKSSTMNLNLIFQLTKELNKIPMENTHFTQKVMFFPIIESIQKVLLQKFSEKSNLKEYEQSLFRFPEFYYSHFKLFSKIGVTSVPLLIQMEENFIQENKEKGFKTNVIAFNMLTNLGFGFNLFDVIKKKILSKAFIPEMKEEPQFHIVKFLLKFINLEVIKFWNSIPFTKDETHGYNFFTKTDFIKTRENLKIFFDSNIKFLKVLFVIIIENKKKEEFSKEIKANLARILEFVSYTERMNKIKEMDGFKENFDELFDEIKLEEIEFYKNEYNYYNQFNADINSILTKNGVKFQTEKQFVYRYCDIYLPEYNIVLELDGKFHYYLNKPNEGLVSNKCRNVFILMKEARMIELSIFDWEKQRENYQMEKILMEKIDFLIKNKDVIFIR